MRDVNVILERQNLSQYLFCLDIEPCTSREAITVRGGTIYLGPLLWGIPIKLNISNQSQCLLCLFRQTVCPIGRTVRRRNVLRQTILVRPSRLKQAELPQGSLIRQKGFNNLSQWFHAWFCRRVHGRIPRWLVGVAFLGKIDFRLREEVRQL